MKANAMLTHRFQKNESSLYAGARKRKWLSDRIIITGSHKMDDGISLINKIVVKLRIANIALMKAR